jgi:hypothetical protein
LEKRNGANRANDDANNEPSSLYDRLGGVYNIATVVDDLHQSLARFDVPAPEE